MKESSLNRILFIAVHQLLASVDKLNGKEFETKTSEFGNLKFTQEEVEAASETTSSNLKEEYNK